MRLSVYRLGVRLVGGFLLEESNNHFKNNRLASMQLPDFQRLFFYVNFQKYHFISKISNDINNGFLHYI